MIKPNIFGILILLILGTFSTSAITINDSFDGASLNASLWTVDSGTCTYGVTDYAHTGNASMKLLYSGSACVLAFRPNTQTDSDVVIEWWEYFNQSSLSDDGQFQFEDNASHAGMLLQPGFPASNEWGYTLFNGSWTRTLVSSLDTVTGTGVNYSWTRNRVRVINTNGSVMWLIGNGATPQVRNTTTNGGINLTAGATDLYKFKFQSAGGSTLWIDDVRVWDFNTTGWDIPSTYNNISLYARNRQDNSTIHNFTAFVTVNQTSQNGLLYNLSPVCAWNFNGNSVNATGVRGTQYPYSGTCNGTIIGATQTTSGIVENAIRFNTTANDQIIISAVNLTSFCVWLNPSSLGVAGNVFSNMGSVPTFFQRAGNFWAYNNGSGNVNSALPVTTGFQHICLSHNGTNYLEYKNGQYLGTTATTLMQVNNIGKGQGFNGTIDEVMIFNYTLTAQEIQTIYNTTGQFYRFDTTNGVIQTHIRNDSATKVNITLTSDQNGGYFNYTAENVNLSTFSPYLPMYQAEVIFNATEIISNASITGGNITINGTLLPTQRTVYLNASYGNATFNKSGYYNTSSLFNISALSNTTYTIQNIYDGILNITVNDLSDNSNFTSFELNMSNVLYNYNALFAPSIGYYEVPIKANLNYSMSAIAIGHSFAYYNFSNATNQNYTFYLYGANSILFTLYDEDALFLNITNATFHIYALSGESQNTTINGTLYLDQLNAGLHNFSVIAENYTSRDYAFTIGNNSYQTMAVYLLPNTVSSTTYTFKNNENGAIISGAITTVQRFINGTLQLVSVLNSDITGRNIFYYAPDIEYSFYTIKTGYDDKFWKLKPLFSAYDVRLIANATNQNQGAFSKVFVLHTPTMYSNNVTNISFTFASPEGALVFYGYNATMGTTTSYANATNAYGSNLITLQNLTMAGNNSPLTLNYYYVKTDGSRYEFTTTYYVTATAGRRFLLSQTDLYGVGIFERVFVVSLLAFFMAGAIIYYTNNITIGALFGAFVFGLAYYQGMIPLWSILIMVLSTFIFIAWGQR